MSNNTKKVKHVCLTCGRTEYVQAMLSVPDFITTKLIGNNLWDCSDCMNKEIRR